MFDFIKLYIEKIDNPYFLMGILLFFWGSFSAVSKLTLSNMDGFQIQFYMFGFASLVMSLFLYKTGKFEEMKNISCSDYLKLGAIGVPQFLYYYLYILSLQWIPVVEAAMLNYLFPVFVVLMAVPINGEKLNRQKLISLTVCFLGVGIIITKGNLDSFSLSNLVGDVMVIMAAASWGLFTGLGRKNDIDSTISNYVYTVTAFILSVVSVGCYSEYTLPNLAGVAGSLWLCMSNILITYFVWFRVFKLASPVLVASLTFITPFVTIMFIMALIGETVMMAQFVGLLIILLGSAFQNDRVMLRLKEWGILTDTD